MKRVKLAALIAAFAASLTLASASSNEPADGYVADAMSAPSTLSYTGTVEVVRIGNSNSQVTIFRVEHRAPNLTKRYYLSPPSLRGDELIVKGTETYAVDAKRHRVVEVNNDALGDRTALSDNVALLRANYRALEASADSVDGRQIEEVQLVNKFTHHRTVTMSIDRATKLVLDKQEFSADGSMISEMRFEEIRYTSQVPVADFDFPKAYQVVKGADLGTPSSDVNHVAQTAGFQARDPKFLPDGFSPVEGKVVEIKGMRTLHLLYSDGLRTVSLFEHVGPAIADLSRFHPERTTIAGHDAQYGSQGAITFLAWTQGPLHCALVGDLPLDELQRIAASITQ